MIGMHPTLYTLPNCPGCAPIKAALTRRPDVASQLAVKDATNPAIAQELNRLGSRSVPTLVIPQGAGKPRILTNPTEILQALGLR